MPDLNNHSNRVTSQPNATSVANNGTDIACLTKPISQNDNDGNELGLEQASSHDKRSYFQDDGYLRGFH